MITALAAKWNSDIAFAAARQISSMSSVYCGPATVGWIAAVWNQSKGRQYDLARLNNKNLFPDGPRMYHGRIPGFQLSINDLLLRETAGELKLARDNYFRVDAIHRLLMDHGLPVIIRLRGPNIRNGLHYIVAYRSELHEEGEKKKNIQLYSQDNGLFGVGNSGLSKVTFETMSHVFIWGAKRVVVNDQ
ncbi:MAG TPA: hypothetical protein VK589_03765 [Chryseolinea sp.]|nr:hypothetical protein [Chryseolinea sp.]